MISTTPDWPLTDWTNTGGITDGGDTGASWVTGTDGASDDGRSAENVVPAPGTETQNVYGSPDGWQLATTLRKGTRSAYGSVDTQFTYPLAKLINTAPDPNVTAGVDDATATLVLTARQYGQNGANITLAVATSTNAEILPSASSANLNIYLENPTSIAPGTLISIFGANLCDGMASASFSQTYLPFTMIGCEIFIDGQRAALLYVSPIQINAEMPVEYIDRTSVSLYSRVTHADGSITVSAPIGVTVVPQNPGIFAGGGPDPRPPPGPP